LFNENSKVQYTRILLEDSEDKSKNLLRPFSYVTLKLIKSKKRTYSNTRIISAQFMAFIRTCWSRDSQVGKANRLWGRWVRNIGSIHGGHEIFSPFSPSRQALGPTESPMQ
jgi:hypothetical protein